MLRSISAQGLGGFFVRRSKSAYCAGAGRRTGKDAR